MKKTRKAPKLPIASKRTLSKASTTTRTVSPSKWIRIERPFAIPPSVRAVLQKLQDSGHAALLVGGCVRDLWLGRPVKDYDIATDALPERTIEIFPGALEVGRAFGVIKVQSGEDWVEVATFREDGKYQDHRRPQSVHFSGPEEDARRRDFTINGLFYDPKTQRILDSVEGLADLRAGIVRAIGDPRRRFEEDALRLLRAIRFSHRLGFELEARTEEELVRHAPLLAKISAERVREELNQLFSEPRLDLTVLALHRAKLLKVVLPEVERVSTLGVQVWRTYLKSLRALDLRSDYSTKRTLHLSWAAVLREVGKPVVALHGAQSIGTEKGFNGHEIEAASIVARLAERLKFSARESQLLVALVGDQVKIHDLFRMREATLQRFIREPHFGELLELHRADSIATDGNLGQYEFGWSRLKEVLDGKASRLAPRLIDGGDLIQLGFSPGPEFSRILRAIEDLALEKRLVSKESALEYVVKNFVR